MNPWLLPFGQGRAADRVVAIGRHDDFFSRGRDRDGHAAGSSMLVPSDITTSNSYVPAAVTVAAVFLCSWLSPLSLKVTPDGPDQV